MIELPPETPMAVRDAIDIAAGRLALARGDAERACVQRAHITSVARHLAEAIHAAAQVPARGEDAAPLAPLDGEFNVAEIAFGLFESHGLGPSELPEAECIATAVRAYLDRLHELTVGGTPWGRA